MFKRKKKKTDCETPEYRKATVPPQYNVPSTTDERLRHYITQVCAKLYFQADEIAKQMEESGFERPTLVIKLFSDDTITVYINEEADETNYIGGTEECSEQ